MALEVTIQAESEWSPRNTVEIDGVMIDTDTGEVLAAPQHEKTNDPFMIEDEDTLHWFLKRVQKIDARIAALQEHPDVQAARAVLAREDVREASAILANQVAMELRLLTAREGLLRWQDAPLRATAAAILAERHEKGRTLHTLFGAVSLKKIAARWKTREGVEVRYSDTFDHIASLPDLLAWAVDCCPQALKQSFEFQISRMPKDADRPAEFFVQEPEHEVASVDTGIGLHTK